LKINPVKSVWELELNEKVNIIKRILIGSAWGQETNATA